MSALALEAAIRSAVLSMLVWVALALVRLRNPHRLKALWTSVVVASLGMPLLMQFHIAPAVAAPMLQWTVRHGGARLPGALGTRALGAFVYLLPTVLLLWRHASSFSRLWSIRRKAAALSAPWADGLDVRVSARISNPSTFGATILLPADCSSWSGPKLTAVMAHERAHVLHRDCYRLWLARLHACIFWFNPVAWWLARQLVVLAEQTSDEAAIETLGNRVDYAEILLGFRAKGALEMATAMGSSDLPARIDRILSDVAVSRVPTRRQLVLLVAAVLPAIALAAAPLQRTAASSSKTVQGSASGDEATRLEPRVVSSPPSARYYPREAIHEGVDGNVLLAVTLDGAGRATDTQILREYPLNMGFGAAASALAHLMQYSNPLGQQVTFDVQVNFVLQGHGPTDHPVPPQEPSGG